MADKVLGTFSSFNNQQPVQEDSFGQRFFEFMGEAKEAVVSTAQSAMETYEDFGTSQAAAFMTNLFSPDTDMTEEMLQENDIQALKEAVKSARNANRSYFVYGDFGTTNEETLQKGFVESFIDPKARMGHFVGSGGKIYTDDQGNTIVEDTYNFNVGPKRQAVWQKLKDGTIDYQTLSKSTPLEIISILGFAVQEYRKESNQPYETQIKINLGKIEE